MNHVAKKEAYQFKGQGINALFGADIQDKTSENVKEVPLKEIWRPRQPRRYFDEKKIQELVEIIKVDGFRGCILVAPLSDTHHSHSQGYRYELVYGGRRCIAMERLDKETIPAEIDDSLTQEQKIRLRYNENAGRQDFSPFEDLEGLLEIMALELPAEYEQSTSQVEADLNALSNESRAFVAAEVKERLMRYQNILDSYGKGKLTSFRSKLIKFRNLPDGVRDAMEEGSLSASAALVIGTLKDEKKRESLLHWAIEHKPTIQVLKQKKAEVDGKQKSSTPRSELRKRLSQLNSSDLYHSTDREVQAKLDQLELLVQELLLLEKKK